MDEYCSYFIKDKCLFGSYPNAQRINELEKIGVKYFIDLTTNADNLQPYILSQNCVYIKYEIPDNFIPINVHIFCSFINRLHNIIMSLENDDKLYIHCKGGHGRAGLVVSCILCYTCKLNVDKSLELTNLYHNKRTVMRDIWRQIGSPQTNRQKNFVRRLFKPIILNSIESYNTYYILTTSDLNLLRLYNDNMHAKRVLKKTLLKPILYNKNNIDIGIKWEEIRKNYILDTNTISIEDTN